MRPTPGGLRRFRATPKNDGVRDTRNLRLAIDDEIVAYMPRCEPSVNSVKNGLRLTRRPRRRSSSETWFTSKVGVIFPPTHSSAMSSVEDVDVGDSAWLVRVASFSSCIGFTRFQYSMRSERRVDGDRKRNRLNKHGDGASGLDVVETS